MDAAFLHRLKEQTELKWAEASIVGNYGFQFLPGTRWNGGLTDSQIEEYQEQIGIRFPDDLRFVLGHLNGTDRPNLNVYGFSGEPHRTAFTAYAYPRDLETVKSLIYQVETDLEEIARVLFEDEGYRLPQGARLFPVYGHRYVVCESDLSQSRVLSAVGTDVITYGLSLSGYLTAEFLPEQLPRA